MCLRTSRPLSWGIIRSRSTRPMSGSRASTSSASRPSYARVTRNGPCSSFILMMRPMCGSSSATSTCVVEPTDTIAGQTSVARCPRLRRSSYSSEPMSAFGRSRTSSTASPDRTDTIARPFACSRTAVATPPSIVAPPNSSAALMIDGMCAATSSASRVPMTWPSIKRPSRPRTMAASTPSRWRIVPTRSRMVGIGAPNELQPKLPADVSEVKAGESLAEPGAPRYCSPSHLIPVSPIPLMRHPRRLLPVVAAIIAGAAACGDTQRLPAQGQVFSDTLIVYALRGTDVSYPTALNVRDLIVVRATGVFDYEIAFDINDAGQAVLYPMELLVAEEASFRRVGMQKLTVPFEALESAPRGGYVHDAP